MSIKIYADGADLSSVRDLMDDTRIAGYTTNPSLLKKAGITNYAAFAEEFLRFTKDRPVSFEILSDDSPSEIVRQAKIIAAWGPNVYVKVPVVNSEGGWLTDTIGVLSREGVKVNVTAVFSVPQLLQVRDALSDSGTSAVISVFAGRIADTGLDPYQHMLACKQLLRDGGVELLWASPRQAYDIKLAQLAGCDIITVTPELLAKMQLFGKSLTEYSRETAAQFANDAKAAGLTL